jgi:lipopolysaccharide transport system ATP-binding protein
MIELTNISKRYWIHRRRQLLAQHAWKKIRRATEEFWALRNVSFRVRSGESVAIVGANGAGKSTLLSIIAGVTNPSAGSLRRNGRVGALLELGTGFHPDLTARENIVLNGSLLGMSRAEVAARFDSIVAFSELERFLDETVRTFSSGMTARLGLPSQSTPIPRSCCSTRSSPWVMPPFRRSASRRSPPFPAKAKRCSS